LVDSESESTVLTLLLDSILTHLVGVDNSPSLFSSSSIAANINVNAFSVLSFFDLDDKVLVYVSEDTISVSEDLPPVRVGASDVHVVTLSIVLDIPRLVVVSGSDGS
jgi:hypothetical protein